MRSGTIPVKSGGARYATGMYGLSEIDVGSLERALKAGIGGEVRFDSGSRALYATDASNFRQPPIGVVIPKTIEDVEGTHRVCREHGAPILARGCGTSLSGETVNHAVVIDFSKYLDRIFEVDPERRIVRCQPGAINDKVNDAAKRHGLVFGPDPSTHAYCTIGGNLGNNSCGVHSVQARFEGDGGRASDNTAWLDVLTYDGLRMRVGPTPDPELDRIVAAGGRRGEIYKALRDLRDKYADEIRARFPQIPRRVSGYNLDELLPERGFNVARALVGTEGTCVTILEAGLNLVPDVRARTLVVLGYDDIAEVGRHVPEVLDHRPIGCEAIDEELFREEQALRIHPHELSQLPDGRAWMMVELGGDSKDQADQKAHRLVARLKKDARPPRGFSIFDEEAEAERLWAVREAALGATAFPPGGDDQWPGWEDSAVPPERVGDYLADLKSLYAKHGYHGAFYGHVGDGCIHSRIDFDLRSRPGIAKYRAFMEEAADLVLGYGGSLSGEHGDGQQRAELLPKMFGPKLVDAFREFKAIWDPQWKMNPGKVVDAYRFDENLKLGTEFNPPSVSTQFAYPEDRGDFSHAAIRCVGVGKCRIPKSGDVMCPSFMVTRDEKHTTRGRARLLYEMLRGDVVTDGWRSREVKEALDLCLACKGCTSDCPVHVDMPTYKAEFLHHHWKGRLRPRHAYAFGLIDQAARVASTMPELANAVLHAPGVGRAFKLLAGMSPAREIPRFAEVTLRDWFFARPQPSPTGRRVILWPDTFNNYFHSEVGIAAVEAIESAGWSVVMPRAHVCCGRPLYDYGFLDLARRYLTGVLDELRDEIRAGTPVIGIEPSCLATFKHELPRLLPHDDDARRLAEQSFHFAEFFRKFELDVPSLEGEALLWGHCHQKATGGVAPDQELLRSMGLEVRQVEGSCCGLAGSWGFESGHHDLSLAAGDVALLPAVRDAADSAVVVADGFSCKTQIEQGRTGRRALHLAEVMKLARNPLPNRLRHPELAESLRRPEASGRLRARHVAASAIATAGAAGLAGLASAWAARALTGRRP